MSEFKTITTQEEFDAAIQERIARNTRLVTAEVEKKYEGFISPDDAAAKSKELKELTDRVDALTQQAAEKDKSISDLTAENKSVKLAALKNRIAHEKGLPFELAARLTGETEEDIGKDADSLAKLVGGAHVAPLGSTEKDPPSGKDAALAATIEKLNI